MFMNNNLLLIIVGLSNLALALSLPLLFAISRLFVHINNIYGRIICYLSSYPRFSCFHWRNNYRNIASSLICLNRRSRFKKIYSLVNSQTRSYSTNDFINKLDESVKTKYNNLPNSSILKHQDSLVASRMVMSNSDVVNTLYNLDSHNDIKHYFYIPENFNSGGIYCFLSKDGLSFYIFRKYAN
jgi:hypothetical protein